MAVLACFALLPQLRAVTPTPDGCYPGYTTAEGCNALLNLTTGVGNTGVGWYALSATATGNANTAIGGGALALNTGNNNTAVGTLALFLNTAGDSNTAVGTGALFNNTGDDNTAVGRAALVANTTGGSNTAIGLNALGSNTTGSQNTATGHAALVNNTIGEKNTASGINALASNTTGSENTATGLSALVGNTTGSDNTAAGLSALANNTTGVANTAFGQSALVGNTTGSSNIALGQFAGSNLTTGNNNIDIGNANDAQAGEANTIRIGNSQSAATFIAGISGVSVMGTTVVVTGNGQLGTQPSSRRFKDQITRMDNASESILALKPVTFRYKPEIDHNRIAQFGLIAEEVEKVNPDLVVHDNDGKPFSVRYDQVNAMLLNEFLKEHKKVEQQDSRIREQEALITQLKNQLQATAASQQKQIDSLNAGLQKVSAQLEVSKPALKTVLNNQ